MLKKLDYIRNLLIKYQKDNNIKFCSVDNKCKIYLHLNNNYKIKEIGRNDDDANVDSKDAFHYHAVTHINVKKWLSYKPGVRIADLSQTEIEWLGIRLKFSNGEEIPIEIVLHSFLHELAHTITMPELHKSANMEKKIKKIQPMVNNTNKFIPNHHSASFYANFSRLLRIADELDIYQLPKTHRNFTVKSIHRYDTMINPSDNLSLGYSRIYSK